MAWEWRAEMLTEAAPLLVALLVVVPALLAAAFWTGRDGALVGVPGVAVGLFAAFRAVMNDALDAPSGCVGPGGCVPPPDPWTVEWLLTHPAWRAVATAGAVCFVAAAVGAIVARVRG